MLARQVLCYLGCSFLCVCVLSVFKIASDKLPAQAGLEPQFS
jgi:hypothetical protein